MSSVPAIPPPIAIEASVMTEITIKPTRIGTFLMNCGPSFYVAEAGSIVAIVSGIFATVSESAPTSGIALGAVGVITALGAIAVPLVKLILESRDRDREFRWKMFQAEMDQREKDRMAKEARHDVANKTQEAVVTGRANEKEIDTLRKRIEELQAHHSQHDMPVATPAGSAVIVIPPKPPQT